MCQIGACTHEEQFQKTQLSNQMPLALGSSFAHRIFRVKKSSEINSASINHIPVEFYGPILNLVFDFRETKFRQLRFGRIFLTSYHNGDENTKETVKRMGGKSCQKNISRKSNTIFKI